MVRKRDRRRPTSDDHSVQYVHPVAPADGSADPLPPFRVRLKALSSRSSDRRVVQARLFQVQQGIQVLVLELREAKAYLKEVVEQLRNRRNRQKLQTSAVGRNHEVASRRNRSTKGGSSRLRTDR
jgi:hypothetical protein